jgi:hypothetical protein
MLGAGAGAGLGGGGAVLGAGFGAGVVAAGLGGGGVVGLGQTIPGAGLQTWARPGADIASAAINPVVVIAALLTPAERRFAMDRSRRKIGHGPPLTSLAGSAVGPNDALHRSETLSQEPNSGNSRRFAREATGPRSYRHGTMGMAMMASCKAV